MAELPASPPPAGAGSGERALALGPRDFARQLRRRMTPAEQRLWYHLRAHRLAGGKFRRQHPLGPYIVDFVHLQARLVVEADGGQHAERAQDAVRDAWLQHHSFRVLRFWNHDILQRTEAVLDAIRRAIEQPPSPPTPLPQGERGANFLRPAP